MKPFYRDIYVALILLNYENEKDPRAKEIPNKLTDGKQNHSFSMSCGMCHVVPWGKGSSHFLLMTADHKEDLETSMNALVGDLWTKYDVDHRVVVSAYRVTADMVRDAFVGHAHWTKTSHARRILSENVALLRQIIRDPKFHIREVLNLNSVVNVFHLNARIRAEETSKFERTFGNVDTINHNPAYIKNVYAIDLRMNGRAMAVMDESASANDQGELQSRMVYNDRTLTLAPQGVGCCISWHTKAEPNIDRLVCDALNIVSLDRNYSWVTLTEGAAEIVDADFDGTYFTL